MTQEQDAAIARALALVGDGYIYGATGWVCTAARRQTQAKQYPNQAGNILGVGAKWDGKTCWDCAQLTKTVAKAAGIALPSGATSQWKSGIWTAKGAIAELPTGSPVFLYRQSGGAMQHTGFCLGDGTFVHAKGTAYGVLHQPLATYAWTHWASPWGGAEVGQTEPTPIGRAMVTAVRGSTVRVRREPGGDVLGVLKLGTVVDLYAEMAGYGLISYNGGKAYMQSAFLKKL